jgi:hypothetical protein
VCARRGDAGQDAELEQTATAALTSGDAIADSVGGGAANLYMQAVTLFGNSNSTMSGGGGQGFGFTISCNGSVLFTYGSGGGGGYGPNSEYVVCLCRASAVGAVCNGLRVRCCSDIGFGGGGGGQAFNVRAPSSFCVPGTRRALQRCLPLC